MSNRQEQLRLDDLAMQYLTALDDQDADTIAALWLQAETDAVLCEMLHGLNAELLKEY